MVDPNSGTVNDTRLIAIYGEETLNRINNVLEACKKHGIRISTAESITAGGIGFALTSFNGSSAVIDSGDIVYCDEAKADKLRVLQADLTEHSAVSSQVAEQMIIGALGNSNRVKIAVAVTGYAGQSCDQTRGNGPGTVFIATGFYDAEDKLQAVVNRKQYEGNRTADRFATIDDAVKMLEKAVAKYIESHSQTKFQDKLSKETPAVKGRP